MAHIRDRGKQHERRWQARYRDLDGRQVSKTFRRKIDAQRWLDEVTADLVTGRYVDPRAGTVKLRKYAALWLESQTFDGSTREGTERRLRLHILPVLGDLELRRIKPSTVQSWLAGVDGAPSSIRVMLVNLSAILSAAVEDGLVASNPCASKSVKPPALEKRRVAPWSAEIVQKVVESHDSRFRAVPVLGAGCGLRQGEIFGLRVEDVDFLRRWVLVRHQVKIIDGVPTTLAPPKGRREREVRLSDVVAVELAEHIRKYPPADGQVFTWRDGGLIHRTYYNAQVWRPAVKAAGITPSRETGMHQLRHHYASIILDGGVSIRALSEYLGHASAKTTLDIYAHLMPDTEDRARQVVDRALGESVLNEDTGIV
ncbi:MAG TPA: tyrosine-type recombinase/integrase [Acidimicrobiia bacterium]|nr:tyrosine-type recombinase/integrase [Acidimicrobiia bacterium]